MDRILVSPGPVEVPAALLEGLPSLHHRTDEFRAIVRESCSLLQELIGTRSPVHLIASSGTGGMEAAVANVAGDGSRALVVSGGKFGDRWAELCEAYGCETERLRFPDGGAVDVEAVRERVERSRPTIVAVTHVESSTGLLAPLREIAEALSGERPLLVVDAVSSLGVEALEMDAWGVDAVVGASQKAFAAPPGVSFVAAGPRVRALARRRKRGCYYFDLARWEEGAATGDLPFTPATGVIQILHRSLGAMERVGFEAVRERHRAASAAFLEAARRLSLESFSRAPSSAVQVLSLPAGCDGRRVLDGLAQRGFIAAGGQGALREKVMRTGFLAIHGGLALRSLVGALGEVLAGLGAAVDRDSAEEAIAAIEDLDGLFLDCIP